MNRKNRKKFLALAPIAAVMVVALWCFDYNVRQDDGMEAKVQASLIPAIAIAQQDAGMPRTQVLGNAKNMTHYRAKLRERPDLVMLQLLSAINMNAEIPPVKLRNIAIFDDMSSAHITVHIAYAGAFGIKRNKAFDYMLPLVAFKHATGSEAYSSAIATAKA